MGTFIGAEHVRHVRTNWKNCLSENRGACSAASLFAIWNRSIAMTVHIHVIIMIRESGVASPRSGQTVYLSIQIPQSERIWNILCERNGEALWRFYP